MDLNSKKFKKHWGWSRYVYARVMIKLRSLIGLRVSWVYAKKNDFARLTELKAGDYSFRQIQTNDLKDVQNFSILDLSESFVEKAFSRGDQCVAAFFKNKIVGYGWYSLVSTEISEGLYLRFNKDCYYQYKSFVIPEHRGNNLLSQITQIKIGDDKLNRKITFSCIETHNYSSLTAYKKNGNDKIGCSAFIENRIGFVNFSSPNLRNYGIEVSKRSESKN